jgi:hypothetical protein
LAVIINRLTHSVEIRYEIVLTLFNVFDKLLVKALTTFNVNGVSMDKTPAMRTVEAATGRDIREVILEAVQRHGSVSAAAVALGLTPAGLYNWIARLDGEVRTVAEVSFAADLVETR